MADVDRLQRLRNETEERRKRFEDRDKELKQQAENEVLEL